MKTNLSLQEQLSLLQKISGIGIKKAEVILAYSGNLNIAVSSSMSPLIMGKIPGISKRAGKILANRIYKQLALTNGNSN